MDLGLPQIWTREKGYDLGADFLSLLLKFWVWVEKWELTF